jgi:hypothetical protein
VMKCGLPAVALGTAMTKTPAKVAKMGSRRHIAFSWWLHANGRACDDRRDT